MKAKKHPRWPSKDVRHCNSSWHLDSHCFSSAPLRHHTGRNFPTTPAGSKPEKTLLSKLLTASKARALLEHCPLLDTIHRGGISGNGQAQVVIDQAHAQVDLLHTCQVGTGTVLGAGQSSPPGWLLVGNYIISVKYFPMFPTMPT